MLLPGGLGGGGFSGGKGGGVGWLLVLNAQPTGRVISKLGGGGGAEGGWRRGGGNHTP